MTQSSNEVAETQVAPSEAALRIGSLYAKARRGIHENLADYAAVGKALNAEKPDHPRTWIQWLRKNESSLGFGEDKAERMMLLARKFRVNAEYTDSELKAILAELWGNEADKKVRGTQGTGENEWHTPMEYIELARTVLGEIDLDPATSHTAQKTVKATKFFTKAEDGLQREWHGRVWMNPPYAQPLISDFVDKIIAERNARRVTAAITLTHNYTDTGWCQDLAKFCDALCFTRGRIRFESPDGELAAPTQGQAFAYFGSDRARFLQTFAPVGFLLVRP